MIVLDVLEEYRRRGIAEMLILRTLDYGKNVARLHRRRAGLDPGRQRPGQPHHRGRGGQHYKTYRIYTKEL